MRGKNRVCFLTIFLAFFLIVGSVTPVINFDRTYLQPSVIVIEPERVTGRIAGTAHAPIVITDDANFSDTATAEGWPGDGSSGNPYIIDGLDINLEGSGGDCISIINTRVNFTISNCHLTGANVSGGVGIYLNNVTYGEIVDNILENNLYHIYLLSCQSMVIRGNTAFHGYYSISLRENSLFNLVEDNNCSYNSNRGFNLETWSNNNTIINNIGSNNLFGIVLYYTTFNTVEGNIFNNNTNDGIHVNRAPENTFIHNYCRNNSNGVNLFGPGLQNNVLLWNTYIDNVGNNAVDTAPGNLFNLSYYSDYAGSDANEDGFGDTPYAFTSNSDSHPLMFLPMLPRWNETPVDQTIDLGDSFRYDLNATAPTNITWSVDDTVHFTIDDLGVLENAIALSAGTYEIEVFVANFYGLSISAIFDVNVIDTTTTTTTSTTTTTNTTTTGTVPPNTILIVILVSGVVVIIIVLVVVVKKRS